MKRFVIVAAIGIGSVMASVVSAQAQWTPPIGIPAPSFGITQVAPKSPSPWTAATPGFYYVDASQSSATDTSNPYGTPAKPRKTIPTSLPAGAVVELHGTYDQSQSSPRGIVANGTSTSPVFIRGASASTKPIIRNYWEVGGNYLVMENLEFGPLNNSQTGSLVLLAPIGHVALRGSDLHGNPTDGGLGIVSWDASLNHDVVIYNNSIHDNGDVNATYDQDVHGIAVSARVSNLWVLDNQLYRNSGDGIQINAASAADQATTHNIYVGRNTSYSNKQAGFWAKQAVDVIFSQNVCHSHRLGNSSMGMCMGYQYATTRAWFLFNNVYDSDFGIGVASDDVQGSGTGAFVIGNVIHNIHHLATEPFNPYTGWSNAAIMLAGDGDHHVINNTIYDVDAGVNVPVGNSGKIDILNNIISNVTVAASNQVFIEGGPAAANALVGYNLFDGDARVRMGDTQQHLTAGQLAGMHSASASPQFVNAAGGDFHLQASSPAIDTGEADAVYATFQQRYGISIATDAGGVKRPSGTAIDKGAYEYAGSGAAGCGSTAPPAPTGLTAAVSGTTITFNWTEPAGCSTPTAFWMEVGSASGRSDLAAASTGSAAATLVSKNVGAGTYYIRVRAQNSAGVSGASNEVKATVSASGSQTPGTPTSFAGTVSGRTITLRWNAPTSGAKVTGYLFQVGTASGRTDTTFPLSASSTTWSAGNAAPGTYYVRVAAVAGALQSAASQQVVLVVK